MLEKLRWLTQGITLYLDNGAQYFQPIAMQIRIPVYLTAGLFMFLCTYICLVDNVTGNQLFFATFSLGCALGWFGNRVVFKLPPDDTGSAPA